MAISKAEKRASSRPNLQPPHKRANIGPSRTRQISLLEAEVAVLPRPEGYEVVTMSNFEYLKVFAHTTVLLPSGALLVCDPSALECCQSLAHMELVGATIAVAVPDQLTCNDRDFMQFFELLHVCKYSDKLDSRPRSFHSAVVTYLIAALKVEMLVECWTKTVCNGFVQREPEHPEFKLWWTLFELFVKQGLINPVSLFSNRYTAWRRVLRHHQALTQRQGCNLIDRAMLQKLLELKIGQCAPPCKRLVVTGPGGRTLTLAVHERVSVGEVQQRVFEELIIPSENQIWEPPCPTAHTDSSGERATWGSRYEVRGNASLFPRPASMHTTQQRWDARQSRGGGKCETVIALVLPTGERIVCNAARVCYHSLLVRQLVSEMCQLPHGHIEFEVQLAEFPPIPTSSVVQFLHHLHSSKADWSTPHNSYRVSWVRLADYLRVEITGLAEYLKCRLEQFKHDGAADFWELVDASRLSSVRRVAAQELSELRCVLSPEGLFQLLTDASMQSITSLTINKGQKQRLQHELGDFYDQWLVDVLIRYS